MSLPIRGLVTFGGQAAVHMAIDEWLAAKALREPAIYLRLYTWDEPAITIGFHQDLQRSVAISALGTTPTIRRVTGGRALLHDPSELTYAVAAPTDRGPLAANLGATGRLIAATWEDWLASMAIAGTYQRQAAPAERSPDFARTAACFASHSRHEITGRRGKLVASAQRRQDNVLLQHGSVKWRGIRAHPALGSVAGESTEPLPPVTESELAQAAHTWMLACTERFGGVFDSYQRTAVDDAEIASIARKIASEPLAHRDFVKQTQTTASQ